jgi:hypothetical protein
MFKYWMNDLKRGWSFLLKSYNIPWCQRLKSWRKIPMTETGFEPRKIIRIWIFLGRAGTVRKKYFKFLSKVVNLSDMKFLGLIIEENLNWKLHIENLINKITPIIYAIRRIRPSINLDATLQLYYAQIYSHLNYMNPL